MSTKDPGGTAKGISRQGPCLDRVESEVRFMHNQVRVPDKSSEPPTRRGTIREVPSTSTSFFLTFPIHGTIVDKFCLQQTAPVYLIPNGAT